MKVTVKKLRDGPWEEAYALDKHVLSSRPIGENEQGYMQFDNTRSEAGEALFQLKYRSDIGRVEPLANAIFTHLIPKFLDINYIVAVPSTTQRDIKVVDSIAYALSVQSQHPFIPGFLVKDSSGVQIKDITNVQAKIEALQGAISINSDILSKIKDGTNVLLLDDLFDSGATAEAATNALKACGKISKVYVVTATWK